MSDTRKPQGSGNGGNYKQTEQQSSTQQTERNQDDNISNNTQCTKPGTQNFKCSLYKNGVAINAVATG